MANDAPKICGFTFNHPPQPINVYWEPNLISHRLADGSLINYKKGFILKGTLSWGSKSWIDSDEYSNIAIMYNQLTATAIFFPKPNTYPNRHFNVQLSNQFNFVPHMGDLQTHRQLYEGTITFESSVGDITATASDIF